MESLFVSEPKRSLRTIQLFINATNVNWKDKRERSQKENNANTFHQAKDGSWFQSFEALQLCEGIQSRASQCQ